ncbi:MAG: hypothetical protein EAZ60_20895 [Oscillatoriales cyanobacterium]|nr:MAG: hypothetical protein EAZ60_20895 [Oscillatoriales cyanobacterium]
MNLDNSAITDFSPFISFVVKTAFSPEFIDTSSPYFLTQIFGIIITNNAGSINKNPNFIFGEIKESPTPHKNIPKNIPICTKGFMISTPVILNPVTLQN